MYTPDKAILSGDMAIPLHLVDERKIKRATTYRIQPMGEDEEVVVKSYRVQGDFIHVPRQLGIEICLRQGIAYDDRTSEGHPVRFPRVPELRDYQEGPIAEIQEEFKYEYDVVFRARTAFGKTISSLWLAAQYGATTLIVVDQDNLKDQWIEALEKFFGFRREDIGIIQGDKSTYRGKMVTIAMIQTLARRPAGKELTEYFGTVIFDEVHTTPTPTFHVALLMFNATRRLAISATPDHRKDALKAVLTQSLGPVRVAADARHERSVVYFFRNQTVYSWYANVSPKIGRLIQEITQDPIRNLELANAIKWMYGTGRRVLAVSTNIDHLYALRDMLYYDGIPDDDMVMYVGQESKIAMIPDPTPTAARPEGWEPDTHYSPITLGEVRKTLRSAELRKRLGKGKITFTTYGKFQKGIDDPTLSAGIDLVPRSAASQLHGRIKRGGVTQMPVWVTPLDENSYRAVHWMAGRTLDYVKDNADIYEWSEDGEITICEPRELVHNLRERVEQLKAMRIETGKDGQHTLVTQTQDQELKKRREKSIVEEIRSAKLSYEKGLSDPASKEKSGTRPGRRAPTGRSTPTGDTAKRIRLLKRQRR